MASNLHLVVQIPHPIHLFGSTTVTPQPRHLAVSVFTCSSEKIPEGSLKENFSTSALSSGSSLPATKVIFAIGQKIEWGSLLEGENVEFHRGNYPKAEKYTYQTGESDIFVGGDVLTGPKFVIDAIAQGHEASESLHRYVQNGHMTIGRNKREFIELDKDDISVVSYDTAGREEPEERADVEKFSFKDPSGIFSE